MLSQLVLTKILLIPFGYLATGLLLFHPVQGTGLPAPEIVDITNVPEQLNTVEKLPEAPQRTLELKQYQSLCGVQNMAQIDAIKHCITYWATKYGQDPARMLRVANCESQFRTSPVNHGYVAGGGSPTGLFQYLPDTWRRYTSRLGKPHYDIWNYEHQAETTAFAFSVGGSGEWACK